MFIHLSTANCEWIVPGLTSKIRTQASSGWVWLSAKLCVPSTVTEWVLLHPFFIPSASYVLSPRPTPTSWSLSPEEIDKPKSQTLPPPLQKYASPTFVKDSSIALNHSLSHLPKDLCPSFHPWLLNLEKIIRAQEKKIRAIRFGKEKNWKIIYCS